MQPSRFALKTRVMTLTVAICASVGLFIVAFAGGPGLFTLQLRFNMFALVPASAVIINLVLLAYFIRKPARTDERFWLSLYLISVVIYAVAEFMQRLSAGQQGAFFWSGFSSIAVMVGPILYLFAFAYTNQSEKRYNGTTTLLLASGLIFLFFETFTNVIWINNAHLFTPAPWGWDSRNTVGPAVYILLLWYYGLLIAALSRLISFRRHTRNAILRKQSLLLIFGVSIPLVGGSITDIILPSIGVTSLPPLAVPLSTLAAIIFIIGLLRYQLLTINPTLFSNTVLAIMQEAVVVTDKTFNVIFVNAKAEELLGIKTGSVKKTDLVEHLARSSADKFQTSMAENANGSETNTIDQIEIMQPHGGTVPVRLTSTRFMLGDYETRVMILTDITKELQVRSVIEHEVKVRTRELNEARAYLVSSIASLEQGFVLVDRSGKIVLANAVVAKLLSLDNHRLVGGAFSEAIAKLPLTVDVSSGVTHVIQTKHVKRYMATESNGSFFDIYLTPVMDNDTVLGATVIIQDVTEAKIMERSKDEFFSIASHELRTPLTAIRGNMSMVQDYFAEQLKDQTLHDLVSDTHAASIRLIEIVNDFLDSSRLEQGKMVFAISPTQIAPIVTSIESDLQILSDQQHNKLTIDPGFEKLPMVMADPARLRQILYNLISNANKYSQNATVTISGEVEDDKVKIRVSDTGKGITPEGQKMLFHKFQQAGDSILTRDNTKGTGLGLYIAKLLAAGMHGTVQLESSEIGKGSTFALTVPIAPAGAKAAPQAVAAPATNRTSA